MNTKLIKMNKSNAVSFGALAFLASALVDAGGVKAVIVTVGGQQYDVTTFTGSYNSNVSKFATPANGGVMPWWGDSSLATQIANAVGNSLGFPSFTIFAPFMHIIVTRVPFPIK